MASLAELLEEEGFTKGKPKGGRREVSGETRATSLPLLCRFSSGTRVANDRVLKRGNTMSEGRPRKAAENGGRRWRDGSLLVREGREGKLELGSGGASGGGGLRGTARPTRGHWDLLREHRWEKEKAPDNIHGRRRSFIGSSSSSHRNRRETEGSYGAAGESSGKNQSRERPDFGDLAAVPALDEAAIRAVASILNGYVRRFFKEESFRLSVRRKCLTCLGLSAEEEITLAGDSGVLANLREAMGAVERCLEEATGGADELKKAALQLSVIGGLNLKDLKHGFTSGVPNDRLAACAHLYLSVICKLRKKDRVSAKYLVQVFCDSPGEARRSLLPQLWEYLFSLHFSELRGWYHREFEMLSSDVQEQLESAYNEMLDRGTYRLGVYYKEWLVEGDGPPEAPEIAVPSLPICEISDGLRAASPAGTSTPGSSALSKKQAGISRGTREEEETDDDHSHHKLAIGDSKYARTSSFFQLSLQVNSLTIDGSSSSRTPTSTETDASKLSSESMLFLTISEEAFVLERRANEQSLNNLAKSIFSNNSQEHNGQHAFAQDMNLPVLNSYCKNEVVRYTGSGYKNTKTEAEAPQMESMIPNSSIPRDFICPLTGQLFEDPVTLETGQTFERAAITKWLDQGNKRCPITGRRLEHSSVPITNSVLKRVIEGWRSQHCTSLLLFATQIAGDTENDEFSSRDGAALFIIEKLLTGFSTEEQVENARHLISLGGLEFLLRRFEQGDLEEKTRVVGLLLCCIKADGSSRSYLASNIKVSCILQLLHCGQIESISKIVSLLKELICLNRRVSINKFLSSLQSEEIVETMHILLVFLKSSLPRERPHIAVLLSHFDMLVDNQRYSIYGEVAVNAITAALESSLSDDKVLPSACRALLMLGGHFSLSGEIITAPLLLKQAGFCGASRADSANNDDECDEVTLWGEQEEKEREEWSAKLTVLLLSGRKRPFLDTISRCLGSEKPGLVKACLATVAWLSESLASLTTAEFQLPVFSALIPRLKECLESDKLVEHRVLASLSMLNFCRISECRVLLRTIAEEMRIPLSSLVEVTWTAKHISRIIFGGRQ